MPTIEHMRPRQRRAAVRHVRANQAFGPAHLRRLLNVARSAAGARYTADLNVDLPIAHVFEGLGREMAFERRFDAALAVVATSLVRVSAPRRGVIEPRERRRLALLRGRVSTICREGATFRFVSVDPLPFGRLQSRVRAAWLLARDLVDAIEPRRRPLVTEGQVIPPEERRSEIVASDVRQLVRALDDLLTTCTSDEADCAETGALLVLGYPGRGKTHLFCDVAEKRAARGLVTVLLMGQHFDGTTPIWKQISRMVNVPSWDRDRILDVLEARARRSGRPALLLVDALNEGGGLALWPTRLARLLADVRGRRWIVIAVSCRTSYAPLVAQGLPTRRLTRIEHNGFALREDEAIARFFSHYGLPLPHVPLLRPEYAVPLFLKLFCAALAEGRVRLPTLGQEGINHLYEAFCRGVGDKIARDLHDPKLRMVPWQCAKAVAQQLAEQRVEVLSRPATLQLVAGVCGTRVNAAAMYVAMLSEGLLAEDIETRAGVSAPVVRFPYQQFSHHLIARYLLTRHFKKADAVASFAPGTPLGDLVADRLSARRNAGLLEALAVQLPERAPVELADLLGQRGGDVIFESAVESITWRKVTAFPNLPAVLRHVNEAIRRGDPDKVTNALLSVAPVPGHPLGIEFLHRNLIRLPLAERDARWSLYLSRQWEASSIIDRVVRWGEGHDHNGMTDADVKPLAVLTTWFFTTSNRFLRDRATKVLVRLLRGRLCLAGELLTLFEDVNDPYVLERLYTAAYGSALLSDDKESIAALARQTYDSFFRPGGPRSSHILMRDAARSIIERALYLDATIAGLDPKRFRPPYRSPWPLRAPTASSLERFQKGDFSTIYWSLFQMGDFGRYVLAQAVYDFTDRSLARPVPAPPPKRRSTATLASLLARSAIPNGAPQDGADESDLDDDGLNNLFASLSEEPSTRPSEVEKFDATTLQRWVFQRVRALGWTPNRFKDFDQRVHYGDQRESRKVERVGKKYQWIALHEGVGRIADHLWIRGGWGPDEAYRICDGAWELGLRDIDPTLLVKSRPDTDMARVWWQPYPAELRPTTSAQQQRWVESGRVPDIRRLVRPRDPTGVDWLALEAHYHWSEPEPPGSGFDRPTARVLWLQIFGYLVPTKRFAAVRAYAEQQLATSHPESSLEIRGVFLRELDWHPSYRHLVSVWTRDRMLDSILERPGERYIWDEGFDASITETVAAYIPGRTVRRSLRLSPSDKPFGFGAPTAQVIDPSWQETGPSILLIRGKALNRLRARRKRTLLWIIRGEKHMAYGPQEPMDWREFHGIFWLNGTNVGGRLQQKLQRARDR